MKQIDLEPAKVVLRAFLNEIADVKMMRKGMSQPQMASSISIKDKMPEFETAELLPASDVFWEEEDAYTWLYADPRSYRALMHSPKPPPISEYYLQPACPLYQQWCKEPKEVLHRNCARIPLPLIEGLSL